MVTGLWFLTIRYTKIFQNVIKQAFTILVLLIVCQAPVYAQFIEDDDNVVGTIVLNDTAQITGKIYFKEGERHLTLKTLGGASMVRYEIEQVGEFKIQTTHYKRIYIDGTATFRIEVVPGETGLYKSQGDLLLVQGRQGEKLTKADYLSQLIAYCGEKCNWDQNVAKLKLKENTQVALVEGYQLNECFTLASNPWTCNKKVDK